MKIGKPVLTPWVNGTDDWGVKVDDWAHSIDEWRDNLLKLIQYNAKIQPTK